MNNKEMLDFIRENLNNFTRKGLASELNITVSKLYKMLDEIGIKKNENLSKNAKNKRWKREEVELLEKYRDENKTVKEISILLNRSENAVSWKCVFIGNKIIQEWTKEEDDLLIKLYRMHSAKELTKTFPSHSFDSIKSRARKLNLKRENARNKKWENEEIELLEKLFYEGYSDKEISNRLNKTEVGVRKYTKRLRGIGLFWTEEETKILKENYKLPNKEIKKKLFPNKKLLSIEKKIRYLGLKKPKSYVWLDEEIELLKKEYPLRTINELIDIFPGKTKNQINYKAKGLKLLKRKDVYLKCFNYNDFQFPNERDEWRREILKRDSYCCKKCGFTDKTAKLLNAHHIIPVRVDNSKKLDINNGICLCVDCHRKIYSKEEHFIEEFQRLIGE